MHSIRLLLYPFLITGINLYFYLSRWNELPQKLVRHYSIDGTPLAYWHKTYAMITIFLLCVGLSFILVAMLRSYRLILSTLTFPRLKIGGLVALIYALIGFITSINFWALRNQLSGIESASIPLYFHLPLIGVSILLAGMQVALAQEYFTLTATEQACPLAAPESDNNWRWGIFYYNPSDTRILIPKRIGIGWTLNFGNKLSVLIIIAIIFIPMLLIALTK